MDFNNLAEIFDNEAQRLRAWATSRWEYEMCTMLERLSAAIKEETVKDKED